MGQIAEAMLAAPFVAGGWDKALKLLASETRSCRVQLLGVGGPTHIPFNWTTDCPDGFVEGLVEIGGGDPALNWRIAAAKAPLQIADERDYDRVRRGMKCAIYDDFAGHYGMPYGCQAVLEQDGGMFIGLAALRSVADGRTGDADREVFASSLNPVLAAIHMQKAVEHQGALLAAGMLESMDSVAFILDGRGLVGAFTAAAERWLGNRPSLRLMNQRLSGLRPAEDLRFQEALASALHRPGARATPLWIGGDDPHLCEIFPLPRRDWSLWFQPRVLVVVRAPSELEPERAELLESLMSLTRAEADVAIRSAQGQSRDEIAIARKASPDTVNAQLKSIFRKAGVRREGELVALVNKLLR